MSTAESWDFVVPEDDAELGAWLRRHGVLPGQRLSLMESGNEPTVDREQWRISIERASAAAAAVASSADKAGQDIARALEPHLATLRAAADHLPPLPQVELDERTKSAVLDLVAALDQALKAYEVAKTSNPEANSPRRRLRFTGMIEGPGDLSTRTDEYLAQGFGKD